MEGNYFHEIFTSGLTGHYFFLINENILKICFGKEYLNNNKTISNKNIKLININRDELRKKAQKIKLELTHIGEKK